MLRDIGILRQGDVDCNSYPFRRFVAQEWSGNASQDFIAQRVYSMQRVQFGRMDMQRRRERFQFRSALRSRINRTAETRFYRAMHFSAKRGIAIACRLSVRPSVRL